MNMETIPDKWKPTVAMLNKYADMNRALEIELGVRADVERGNVPHSWYAELKKLNWDAKKFKENFLKEIENEKRTEKDPRRSGNESDSGSDMSSEECGRGHMADECPEGCTEGECEHPRSD